MSHHINSQNVPETLKPITQKRLRPNSSGGWPETGLGNDLSSITNVATNFVVDSTSDNESLALQALENLSQNSEDISYRSITIESIHNLSGSEGISTASADNVPKIATNSNSTIGDTASLRAGNRTNYSLHLSNLPVDLTENIILDYNKVKGISDTDGIKITKHVKRNADLTLPYIHII